MVSRRTVVVSRGVRGESQDCLVAGCWGCRPNWLAGGIEVRRKTVCAGCVSSAAGVVFPAGCGRGIVIQLLYLGLRRERLFCAPW